MSSLWTPGGERPVPRGGEAPSDEATRGAPAGDDEYDADLDGMTPEEAQQRMRELQDELARTPAATVVANHCFGLFELAALHLSTSPPQLSESQLAIDALAALVEGLGSRLRDYEPQLREALAQLRLAFVQIRAAGVGGPEPDAAAAGAA
ncbi:MAG TPA: hypothetical protein VHN98_12055, partial [Acidimicrobiales bacterium]|nr:hypothetical protein [Acidimicrobiales bacterium]